MATKKVKHQATEELTATIPSVTNTVPQSLPAVAPEVAVNDAVSPAESSAAESAYVPVVVEAPAVTETVVVAGTTTTTVDVPPQANGTQPEANIVLSGDKDPSTGEPYQPITTINMGMETITLPDAATQRAGWFDKRAGLIIRATSPRYKLFKKLGA